MITEQKRGFLRSHVLWLIRVVLSAALLTPALCSGADSPADPSEKLRELTQRWIDVSEEGDIDLYLSLTTENFNWIGNLTSGGYQGRDEVRRFLSPFFQSMEFSVDNWSSDEVVVSGSGKQAIHLWTGTAVSARKDGSGQTIQRRKYVDVWIKQESGEWLCSRHLFVVLGKDR